MEIKPVPTKADHKAALKKIEGRMMAKFGTLGGDRLDVLVTLVEAYETKHFPLNLPYPVEVIKFNIDQTGLTMKDFEPMSGRSNRIYEIFNHTRPLRLAMIRKLHAGLGIPVESLIKEYVPV